MTTFLTVCTDVEGIRQEFADALELENEWQVPYDIDLEIWTSYEREITEFGEQHYPFAEEVWYGKKQLHLSPALEDYINDKLQKVTV